MSCPAIANPWRGFLLSGMVRPERGKGDLMNVERRSDERLKRIGVVVSVIWLVGAGLYVGFMWSKIFALQPNEFGDFLAGVFAPLAFFWLVLGFYQQGEELRASVDALTLQSEEMRNSVEQQRLLAEATREQVDRDRAAAELAVQRSKASKLRVSFEKIDGYHYKLIIHNAGEHDAFKIQASSALATSSVNVMANELIIPKRIAAGDTVTARIVMPLGVSNPFAIRFGWVDGLGFHSENYTFSLA